MIVAPAEQVVDAQNRLDIAHDVALGQELPDGLADERRAPEAAADQHLETGIALGVAVQAQPDIVHLDGGAVMARCRDGDLELARQKREFRMQRGILAQHFGPDARILDLVGGDAAPTGRW